MEILYSIDKDELKRLTFSEALLACWLYHQKACYAARGSFPVKSLSAKALIFPVLGGAKIEFTDTIGYDSADALGIVLQQAIDVASDADIPVIQRIIDNWATLTEAPFDPWNQNARKALYACVRTLAEHKFGKGKSKKRNPNDVYAKLF